jgi:hypothetical protein
MARLKYDIVPAAELAAQECPKSGAELALDIATAIQHLAQQLELSAAWKACTTAWILWHASCATSLGSTDWRLSTLELYLNPQEQITEAQVNELALVVKAVAAVLSGPDQRTNGYPQVYAKLYRHYRISSYKNLPQGKFEDAMM